LALVKGEREKTKRAEKMTESEGKREKMLKQKKGGSLLVFTGGAAVLAIAVNLAITALKHHKEKNAKKKGISSSSTLQFSLTLRYALQRPEMRA